MKLQANHNKKQIGFFLAMIMALNFSLIGQESIKDSLYYFNIGFKAHESGDYKKALKFYNKQFEITPNDWRTYNNRGNIFVEMGEEEKALEDYFKALSIDSSIQFVRNNIGIVKFDKGLFGESVEFYKQEIEVNPKYCDAYNNLGYTYYMLEEFDLAIDSYKKALDLDTNCLRVKINLENARQQKAINEKWKDRRAKYNRVVYDSSFNKLKELGFPSAYNRKFVSSPHYIYDNWSTYNGAILKLYENNNKLYSIRNLKNGVENGYGVHFNFNRDLDRLSYTSQTEKYVIEIRYGLKYNAKQRKFELGYTPRSVRIKKIHDNKYINVDITYKKRKFKIKESHDFKSVSLFAKRVKDTAELLEFLKSKDYLSSSMIEKFVVMGGLSREGKSQEEIVTNAGFKSVILNLMVPFND